jgi:LacI family transcriptional regulator
MSERTRMEVIELAVRLGYRTKGQEQSFAIEQIPVYTSKPRRFALLVPPAGPSYIHQLLHEGLQSRLAEFGHKLELLFTPQSNGTDAAFGEWLDKYAVLYTDGLFLSPMIAEPMEERLLRLATPKVLLNYPPPAAQVDSVMWDVYAAVHQSVQYLLSNGHRQILYIGDIQLHRGFRLRWQAFQEAMATAGMPVEAEHHLTRTYSKETYIRQLTEILKLERPSALLVGVDHDLAWVYYACNLLGHSIPGDYSIIGLEHSPSAAIPELTCPKLLIKEAGMRGADRMLWRISNPTLPYEHIRLQGGFYEGGTVIMKR